MDKDQVTVGLIQMRAHESRDLTLAKVLKRVQDARDQGARIVCLQELFISPYFPQSKDSDCFRLAETIPGPTTGVFSELARELGVDLIVPLFERAEGRYYNSVVVIDGNGVVTGKYRKMHLPNEPCYYEKFYFTPGNLGYPVFQTKFAKIGVLVCWDQWFPEAARMVALGGAQILFCPTSIGWHAHTPAKIRIREKEAWQLIQRAHAIANGLYVAAVNRVGREGALEFWGSSFVAGPFGELMSQAGSADDEIILTFCDLSQNHAARKEWPFLTERRIDSYDRLGTSVEEHA